MRAQTIVQKWTFQMSGVDVRFGASGCRAIDAAPHERGPDRSRAESRKQAPE